MNILHLRFEITHSCNLHCKHCFNRSGEGEKDLSTKQIFSIIDQLSDLLKEKIYDKIDFGFSGGESFNRPDFWKIIDYLLKNNIEDFNFLTNGTYLTNKTLNEFKELGLKPMFVISWDSDFIRGKGNQKKVYPNIVQTSENFYTMIKSTICEYDLETNEIFKTYNTFKDTNIGGMIFNPVGLMGRWFDFKMKEPNPETYLQQTFKITNQHFNIKNNQTLAIDPFYQIDYNGTVILFKDFVSSHVSGCKEMHITADGNLLGCLRNYNSKKYLTNLTTQNIHIRNFVEQHRTSCKYPYQCLPDNVILNSNPECQNCEHWQNCKAGVGLYRQYTNGKKDELSCHFFKDGYYEKLRQENILV